MLKVTFCSFRAAGLVMEFAATKHGLAIRRNVYLSRTLW